ncbi:glycosyltransferase [Phytohabitans sp. ZYX-F-186]|uniref:Glycosyltransferase n=1 Tax=Phytohabitans maris TaxID=3071409 RepID=A0ABU0ZP80_9ACTN|nr:glycosyltransferase [Phytohabitans sp. ZYX-F-186]MDQ7908854.1 glycosyltransferase [Phytohabitans sp. ZYX-F-186]
MRWLAFGTFDVERHPRVAVLIEGLRASGDEVVEVNAPLRLSTAARVAMLRQPWRVPLLAWRLASCWTRLAVGARRERRGGQPDAVLVGYLGHFDVRLARRLFRSTPIALDHLVSAAGTAEDRALAGSGGVKHKLMRWIDRTALSRADVVVVDTAEQGATLPPDAAQRAVVVPVGAGDVWFGAGDADTGDDPEAPLRVIFVGLFTPLHGAATIGEAVAELADDDRIAFTMVGTGQDYRRCRELAAANPRVTWLDWVPGAELPALVARHDVSLGIFGTTDKALRVVPTKVYQGLAAGCVVVTSDTAPQRTALDGTAVLVPPGDPVALAEALRSLADDRHRLAKLKSSGQLYAAERFRPAAVVAQLRRSVDHLEFGHR